ncbi:DUF1295 domain-containing protein [Candidatus Saccharibacteria bacterium]|nr:DUF1295 domain-containing protein [Candidatus Saccharibacteria bacterium]
MDWLGKLVTYWATSFIAILVFQTVIFAYIRRKNRYDVADVIWAPSILVGFLSSVPIYPDFKWKNIVVAVLVLVWAFRLSYHIYRRFISKNEMDERYIKLIGVKPRPPVIYLKVFVVQSLMASIISLTFIALPYADLNVWALAFGVIVWLVGFTIESLADNQLAKHIKYSHEIMKDGLWHYSRHPNYFGEIMQWWGLWIVSVGSGLVWLAVIGPITITYLIIFVSGIPMLEKHMSTKSGWEKYKEETPVLIPRLISRHNTG